MKFLILSDLHGSATAFAKCLEAFAEERADWLVLCGDYLNHGPRNAIPEGYDPPRLASMLNAHKARIIAVRGNCDSEVDGMLLEFPYTADYTSIFSMSRRCFVTHGHLWSPDELPTLAQGDVFVSGHTHVPVLAERNGIVILNPGSPSIPKGGSAGGYATLDENGIELKTLSGSIIATHRFFA
jgi:uncharacterized protein